MHRSNETGTGHLEATGLPALRVRYRIDVQQQRGLPVVTGRVTPPDTLALFEYVGLETTLILEDGRRWECRVTSADGRLVNRGQNQRF